MLATVAVSSAAAALPLCSVTGALASIVVSLFTVCFLADRSVFCPGLSLDKVRVVVVVVSRLAPQVGCSVVAVALLLTFSCPELASVASGTASAPTTPAAAVTTTSSEFSFLITTAAVVSFSTLMIVVAAAAAASLSSNCSLLSEEATVLSLTTC